MSKVIPKSSRRSAAAAVVHGVLLDVHGLGVLIEGAPGIGKGTLALELLRRGHRLVADDAVEVRRVADGVLVGSCPELLRGHLEVRGLGILNIRKLHGARALRANVRIEFVIRLAKTLRPADRLGPPRRQRRILGERLDRLDLDAGRRAARNNLAGRVEAACLQQELRLLGRIADDDFERRQMRAIRKAS